MKIFIKTLEGKIIDINVNPIDSIVDVKYKIYEKESIPIYKQHLVFKDITLNDKNTLIDYDVHDKDVFYLNPYLNNKIQIIIQVMDYMYNYLVFQVNLDDTIESIIMKIKKKCNIYDDCRLVLTHNARILKENFTVADSYIQQDSTLILYTYF